MIKKYRVFVAGLVFIALPVLFYALGDFPRRTVLKEVISITTILAFFVMLMQFFLSRANRNMLVGSKMRLVVSWHRVIGYVVVSVFILHPLLIIVPRFFEAGVDPADAFVKLLSSFGSKGVFLGISAWILMVFLGTTSLLRKNLGLTYKAWRIYHGILSVALVATASFHVVELGRHINTPMKWLIILLSIFGLTLLLTTYLFIPSSVKSQNHE